VVDVPCPRLSDVGHRPLAPPRRLGGQWGLLHIGGVVAKVRSGCGNRDGGAGAAISAPWSAAGSELRIFIVW